MTDILPLSLSASVKLQRWPRLAAITPQHPNEHWLLHLTDQSSTATALPQTTTLHLVWNGWLITSCRSANNIMPITIFLPAFIASFFYSA